MARYRCHLCPGQPWVSVPAPDLSGRPQCGTCHGANYVYTGEVFRPRFAAPGPVMAQCPDCGGNGAEVKPGPTYTPMEDQ